MRRLLPLLVLGAAACGHGSGSQGPVPQSPQEALTQFMTAVKAKDLQRLGHLWGSERGPAAAWMKSEDLTQRITVFQIYLNHVGYRVIDGPAAVLGEAGRVRFNVEIQRENGCSVVFPIDLGRARSGAWLVWSFDLATLGNPAQSCQPKSKGTGP